MAARGRSEKAPKGEVRTIESVSGLMRVSSRIHEPRTVRRDSGETLQRLQKDFSFGTTAFLQVRISGEDSK